MGGLCPLWCVPSMCLLRVLLLSMACHVWRGFGLTRCDSCRWVWRSSANEGHLVDALVLGGDEGRGTLRKARGRCERSVSWGAQNGSHEHTHNTYTNNYSR